ncbi:MAG TPA: hypothetical protein VK464_15900 [Symbiobacteriaceae bacterium]|nr:hypothetical protein [Symbiobacteriaceae bacterium]
MNLRSWKNGLLAVGAVLSLLASAALPQVATAAEEQPIRAVRHRIMNGSIDNAPAHPQTPNGATTMGANGIDYHGGPLILGTTNIYVIWYGNWTFPGTTSATTTIIPDFLSHLGGSSYYNINTTYTNGAGTKVSNSVAYKGYTTDNYSQGSQFGDTGVKNIVSSAITSGRLPSDTNAVYLVLTSSDVKETSGFLTRYCGWHTNGSIGGKDIKYSFVGDPARNYSACSGQTASSPNSNISADAMISVIAHEIEEAVTDPDLNAWYDAQGAENADKCAWTWGTTSTASNGSKYNMTLGSRNYLIQQNWVNAGGGYCSKSY